MDNHIAVAFKLKLKELQQGLKEAEKDFDKFSKSAGKDVDKLDRKSKKLTGSIVKWGASLLSVYLGLQLITSGVKSAVEVGSSFESVMYKVKAISGATRQEWMELEQQALKLGSSTRFSATEVGHLQVEYSKLGFVPKMITEMTEATLNLTAATGENLAEVSSVVGGVLNAYNYNASETNRITDVMAKLFSSSAEDLQKFKVAIGHAGTTSARFNLEIEDTSSLLGVLVDRNIRAETTGTGVRNILSMMNNESHKLNQVLGAGAKNFDELIARFKELGEDEYKYTEALKAVGLENENVFATLVDNVDAIEKLRKGLNNAEGAAKRMADIMEDNFQGAITELKSATEGLGISFFKTFNQGLTAGARKMAEFVRGMSEMMSVPMADQMEDTRIKLNGLVSAIITSNTNQKLRNDLIAELQVLYPDFLKNIDVETATNKELAGRLAEVNEEMVKNIVLQDKESELKNTRREEADALIDLIKYKKEFGEKMARYEKAYDIEIDKTQSLKMQYTEMSNAVRAYDKEHYGKPGMIRATMVGVSGLARAYGRVTVSLRELATATDDTSVKNEELIELKKELGLLTDREAAQYLSIDELMARMTEDQKAHAQEILDSWTGMGPPVEDLDKKVREYYWTLIKAQEETGTTGEETVTALTNVLSEFTIISDYLNSVQKAGYEQAIRYNKEKLDAIEKEIKSGALQGKELQKLERAKEQLTLKNMQLADQWAEDSEQTLMKIDSLEGDALSRRLNRLSKEEDMMLEHLAKLGLSQEAYEIRRLQLQKYYANERVNAEVDARQREIDAQTTKAQREYELGLMSGFQFLQFLQTKDAANRKMLEDELITEEQYAALKEELNQQSLNVAMRRFGLLRQGYKEFLKGEAKDFITAQQIKLFGKLAEIMAVGGATLGTSLAISLPLYGAGLAALELAKIQIDKLAEGTRNYKGGLSWVGEQGPELMFVPKGADVYSNSEVRNRLSPATIHQQFNPTVNNTEEIVNRVVAQVDTKGIETRLEDVEAAIHSIPTYSPEEMSDAFLDGMSSML